MIPKYDSGHMIRAVMEGVVLNLTWIYQYLAEMKSWIQSEEMIEANSNHFSFYEEKSS
ncbi:hypothetical protein ACI2OX_03025 [Bacillus sp. N9]